MTFRGTPAAPTNWSTSAHSSWLVYQPHDSAGIGKALAVARTCGLSVLPHGAGHSSTDTALNTDRVVIDLKPMRRMLSWDAARARGKQGGRPNGSLKPHAEVLRRFAATHQQVMRPPAVKLDPLNPDAYYRDPLGMLVTRCADFSAAPHQR